MEYSKFKRLYEDVYYICENVERGMSHIGKKPKCEAPFNIHFTASFFFLAQGEQLHR